MSWGWGRVRGGVMWGVGSYGGWVSDQCLCVPSPLCSWFRRGRPVNSDIRARLVSMSSLRKPRCTVESVCLSLSVCLPVCLSVCLSVSVCLSACLSAVCLSVSVCLSACLSVCLPVCLSVCLSVMSIWYLCV